MIKISTIEELKQLFNEQKINSNIIDCGIGIYEYHGTKYNHTDFQIEIMYDFIECDITDLINEENYHFDLKEISKFYIQRIVYDNIGKEYQIELEINLEGITNDGKKIIGKYYWGI